jgi:hypothetical protein
MDSGDTADSSDLDTLRDLCAGLGGSLANGDVLAWAGAGDLAAVPDAVFRVISDAGLLGDGYPLGTVSMPADGDALMERLWEIDETTALGLLASLAGSKPQRRQHHFRQRYPDPEDVFTEVAGLIGPETRWWTNTDLSQWNPITQHTFDAVVVGAGNGIIVTVVAFEGGG